MALPLTTTGDSIKAGTYDVTATLTTGTSSIERSFDSGTTWEAVTDGSWTATATVLLGPVAGALYRSVHTGDGVITMRQVG